MIRAYRTFWDKVEKVDDAHSCWEWKGYRRPEGYGRDWIVENGRRRKVNAHAIAYFLDTGVWERASDGRVVRHRCDNPACCRPDHLQGGSHADNVRDTVTRGRMRKGASHHNAKFSDRDVRAIRARAAAGEGVRALAREFQTAPSVISCIVSRKSWGHLD
ncbi:MAG: HNH endonuclease [Alphaproteobacteria bacterium]|nr:HNH endonuclease [Alphaproteobacteria bacterium]